MTVYTNARVEDLRQVIDADGQEAAAASDERLESVRQQGANGVPNQVTYSTGGTAAEALNAQAVPDGHAVEVQAADDNTDTVYVGDSDTQARALKPRETWIVGASDLSDIYVQTPTAGETVVVSWVSLA